MGLVVRLMAAQDTVTQEELEILIGFENQIRQLQRLRSHQRGAIVDRLLAGAAIEPGTHTAEIQTDRTGGDLVTRLVIY